MPQHQNKRLEIEKKRPKIKSFACSQSFSHFSARWTRPLGLGVYRNKCIAFSSAKLGHIYEGLMPFVQLSYFNYAVNEYMQH